MNCAYYCDVFLSQQLLPMMHDVLMCQPSSSSFNRTALLRTGHVTLRLLELATPALFHQICGRQTVPTSIQLTDYKVWSVVQQRVYQSLVYNVDELKQRLVHVWHGINQTIIDNSIDEWRGRLRDCVRAKGGHFEQML